MRHALEGTKTHVELSKSLNNKQQHFENKTIWTVLN